MTLGNWIFVVGISLLCGFFGCIMADEGGSDNPFIIGIVVLLIVGIICTVGCIWYNNNTASGIRRYKDYQSNINNGINREITITAEDGRQIYHYEGKVDIESNHTDNYIKFEREDGKRMIIYYGVTDTIIIEEK